MPQLNELSFVQIGGVEIIMQHNICFLMSWQKKNIYLSIDKKSKTNQLLLNPQKPFPVYFHAFSDTISYILCTPPCVVRKKG